MSKSQHACQPEEADHGNELEVASFAGPAGYAVLDQSGHLLSKNSQIATLLGDSANGSRHLESLANLSGAILTTELSDAIAGTDAVTMAVSCTDSRDLQLQFGSLRANRRLLIVQDINQMRRQGSESLEDAVTGLGSRDQLDNMLTLLESERADLWAAQSADAQDADCAAVLLIGIDRFKQVNDTLGYITGDSLLRLVAGRLRRLTRDTDRLIRVGGDEFLLVLPQATDFNEVSQLAERIVQLIARPFLIDAQQVNIGVSIGVATFNAGVQDAATLLQNADLALHEAKNSGRSQMCSFLPRMAHEARQRRDLEIDLRRALALKQFRLAYQPQVDLHTGNLTGFEALLRWEHPVRGSVSPADFIPVAEDIGEIRQIGAWVLQEACRQACDWPAELTLAVNVSPLQFDDGTLVDTVTRALGRSGLSAHRLEVEVTEGLLFHNPTAALSQLGELRQLGIEIAMDDFGTGYSSLSHLSRFPFTKVKIDQSFVRGDVDDRTRALVKAIVSLGASLSMKTLAEGVETSEQYHRMKNDGCDAVQGYLISRPMEAGSTGAFVERYASEIQGAGVAL